MSGPVLEAVDVVKFLGSGAAQVQALRGVSLALSGGELTLLMGPSGSGKTTLLSVLGCMLSPTSGSVRVAGRSTDGAGPEELAKLRREHVGFVFQSYHLFPTLTAGDNVRLALDVRGENSRTSAIAKASEALAMVGLSHKIRSYPSELSGGEQQRVAIARAIVGNASAILADEPTAALDSENGHTIMRLLARIAKDPARGVLVVTHDPRILPFANRVVRIEDGHIVGEERRAQVFNEKARAIVSAMVTPKGGSYAGRGRLGRARRRVRGDRAEDRCARSDARHAGRSRGREALAGGCSRPGRAGVRRDQDCRPLVGMIGEVLVKTNDKVFAGEPLIRLTDNEAQAQGGDRGSAGGACAGACATTRRHRAGRPRVVGPKTRPATPKGR